MTFEDLLVKYVEYYRRADPKEEKAFNRLKGEIGEQLVEVAIDEKFGGAAKDLVVPRRGSSGPPVLDGAYEFEPGKYLLEIDGQAIIVEAKYGTSELSRSNLNRRFVAEWDGKTVKMVPAPAPKQVVQLDADWVRARIKELRQREQAAAAAGAPLDRSLADLLERAAKNEKLFVLEVRSRIEMVGGELAGVEIDIVNHTDDFRKAYRGRRTVDVEGALARKESLATLQLDRARIKAREAKAQLKTALSARRKAERKVATAEKWIGEAGPRTRPATRKRLQDTLVEREEDLRAAQAEVWSAERDAERTTRIHDEAKTERDRLTALRKEEAREKRAKRQAEPKPEGTEVKRPPEPEKPKVPTEKPAVPSESRAVESKGVANKAVDATGATSAEHAAERTTEAAAKTGAVKAVETVIIKEGRLRTIARYALRGPKALLTVGKFAFRVVEFANPILDLLMAVDAVDWLVEWLQSEKIAQREEWKRIAYFLSAPTSYVKLPPHGVRYRVACGDEFSERARRILSTEGGYNNFVTWFDKWNADTAWGGFVYVTATMSLERQELRDPQMGDPSPVTYFPDGPPTVYLTDRPAPNEKGQGPEHILPASDPHNYRAGGKVPHLPPTGAGSGSRSGGETYSDTSLDVDVSTVWVRYTYLDPIVTPFDYILTKSNSLVALLVAFISKYDERIFEGRDVFDDLISGVLRKNWFDGFEFRPPLYGPYVKWCFEAIDRASLLLREHQASRGDDVLEKNTPNKVGYLRRLKILRILTSQPGTKGASFSQIAGKLNQILLDEDPRHLLASRDKSLDGLKVSNLCELALNIDADLLRTFEACRNSATAPEFNYEGPPGPRAAPIAR